MVATPLVVVAPLLALGPSIHTLYIEECAQKCRRSGRRAPSTLSGHVTKLTRMTLAWRMLPSDF
jgi:hypothetical protein